MKYNGFIIQRDGTLSTEVYYIRREDGSKWQAMDGTIRTIESLQDSLENVKEYIDAIREGEEMKNATLVIRNNVGLARDIWQGVINFTPDQWQAAIDNFADTLQQIYHDADRQEDGIEDGDLYILGDVINLLKAIDIRIE